MGGVGTAGRRVARPDDRRWSIALVAIVAAGCTSGVTTTGIEPDTEDELVGLEVSPASALLEAGSELRFGALGQSMDGTSSPVAVTWSATGGSIQSDGLYTADGAEGAFEVVAVDPVSGLADTARVTILATGSLANECQSPAPEWIWCDDFDQDRLAAYFEYHDASGSLIPVPGSGMGGSTAMRGRFGPGQADAGSLRLALGRTPDPYFRPVDAGTRDYRELYWRFYFKQAAGWVGGGGDKLTRAMVFSSPTWAQAVSAHVWSGPSGTSSTNHLLLDPASGTDAAGNLLATQYNDFANWRWLGLASSQTPIYDSAHLGAWYCIEVQVRLNDAGASNGEFRLWIDGAVEAEQTGLNWLGSYDAYGLNSINLENYWEAGSPVQQDRHFDNFVVSESRIGCG